MKEPKIRLKGFTREWEKKVVGDMGTTYSGLSGKTREDFGQGDASYVTFLNVLTNAQIDTSILEPVNVAKSEHQNLVKKGDLLFNTSSETPDEVGLCAVMDEDVENVYLNSFCFGFRVTDSNIDPKCVAYLMRSPIGRTLMSILGQGATRYNLSKNNFCKSDILLPSDKDEQESIAEYFQNLDSLIQSTNKKIESLKQVKVASLQSMFPQEGETTPRVRFKGFEGEWDVVTIDSICKKSVSKHSENSLGENVGQYPIYGASGYIQNIETYDFDVPYVGVIKDGSGVGRSQLYPAYSSILGTMQYILPKGDMDVTFLAYLFETINFSSYVNGSSIPHIYFKDYSIKNVKVPSINEQRVIGEYFQNLDSQIALLSQQLEKLQQIKSACLDNMFV